MNASAMAPSQIRAEAHIGCAKRKQYNSKRQVNDVEHKRLLQLVRRRECSHANKNAMRNYDLDYKDFIKMPARGNRFLRVVVDVLKKGCHTHVK